ncbi:AAA family ATPase [Argonema antarcticum]|uniref:AAA family ATPase n=1 Tax=Argonema antarcticum TaxID=2942763 RepID=UPI0020139432|nr:MoxR family ATPase [Argonema antarcticum]MCL1472929.1 MoxR family ATPase [Argonema antarcticum A004/B2]
MTNLPIEVNLEYTGNINPEPGTPDRSPYSPSDELKQMVKLAIALERPLLLMGDPGVGKTQLASAIAYEFTQKYQKEIQQAQELVKEKDWAQDWIKENKWPLYPWYIKSTSRAKDGLYTYDAVGRLRDTQLVKSEYLAKSIQQKTIQRLEDETQGGYIKFGALGKAFQTPIPAIVLIDEIDKADIDFPNDLLLELDEKRFFIEETDREVKKIVSPLIIVTSNEERTLPNAFLRRCLFHYLDTPSDKELKKIIKLHFGEDLPNITEIIAAYRELLANTAKAGGKKASPGELLDFIKVAQGILNTPVQDILKLMQQNLGVLLKTRDELTRHKKSLEGKKDDSR